MPSEPAFHSTKLDRTSARIQAGRAAVAEEASALWTLSHEVGLPFAAAIQLLTERTGRIVVAGLGKSGQIAGKIAATFTATGHAAAFLHAGDALHGDMGAIGGGDVVLLLSRSGETRDCCAIAMEARHRGAAVLVITANDRSALAQIADVVLPLPDLPEICPFRRSPTTSTTMMLALGDALAIVLMQETGVTPGTLRRLHPKGSIGRDLISIATIMHQGDALPCVRPDLPVLAVLDVMSDKGFGIALVVDTDGQLLGVITDGDVRRHAILLADASAAEVMTADPQSIRADAVVGDALALLGRHGITALAVTDSAHEGRLAGLVHIQDLLRLGIA